MSRIVNLGSLCIDHVYQVEGFARSGETLAALGYACYPGGKGLNQSLAAAAGGAQVLHAGAVGHDGDLLINTLEGAGVDVSRVLRLEGPSGHASIQVTPAGENSIVIVGGANRELDPGWCAELLSTLAADDWLLLQNEINNLEAVLEAAAAGQARVAFNAAPADARLAAYPLSALDLLIVNEAEAEALSGISDYDDAVSRLMEMVGDGTVVLTRGKEGLLYGYGGKTGKLDAFVVEPVDETAAGDAFVGFFLAALSRGDALESALREGSAAGALAVTQAGAATSIPTREAVSAFLSANA